MTRASEMEAALRRFLDSEREKSPGMREQAASMARVALTREMSPDGAPDLAGAIVVTNDDATYSALVGCTLVTDTGEAFDLLKVLKRLPDNEWNEGRLAGVRVTLNDETNEPEWNK